MDRVRGRWEMRGVEGEEGREEGEGRKLGKKGGREKEEKCVCAKPAPLKEGRRETRGGRGGKVVEGREALVHPSRKKHKC